MSWDDWNAHQHRMNIPSNYINDNNFVHSLDSNINAESKELVISEMRSKGLLCNTAMVIIYINVIYKLLF